MSLSSKEDINVLGAALKMASWNDFRSGWDDGSVGPRIAMD